MTPKERYASLSSLGYNEFQKNELLKPVFQENSDALILRYFSGIKGDELSKTFYSDAKLVLEGDMLTKVDRACMINSLEARVPFLDSKIEKYTTKLQHNFKINKTNKKKILSTTKAINITLKAMQTSTITHRTYMEKVNTSMISMEMGVNLINTKN